MKDFGIISGPIIAALAAAAKAAAATKVGAAVVGGVKAVGAKLAATKVGGAVVKGAKFLGKGIKALKGTKVVKAAKKGVEAVKKVTGKITPKIGGKAGETAATTATEGATKAVTEGTTKAATETAKAGFKTPTTPKVDVSKVGADVAKTTEDVSKVAEAPKISGDAATTTAPKEKSWLDRQLSTENLMTKGQESLARADAQGEAEGQKAQSRASAHFASAGQDFGGTESHVPQEELGSVLTFKRAMPKPIPLRLRTKRALSPFKSAGKMKYDAALGWGAEKTKEFKKGLGELGAAQSKIKEDYSLESLRKS